jgi:SAM-dependent methyltransferase
VRSAFPCPICSRDDWTVVQTTVYRPGDRSAPGGPLTEYELVRRRILFEVWCPGVAEVTLQARACGGCGFVAYSPRPTEDDLDAHYRYLQEVERNIGGSHGSARARELDRRRARRTARAILRHRGDGRLRVLDHGGGDGKLLEPFLARGDDCALVDYNVTPLAGVRKVGDTLDDVSAAERYDAIVCSHVLEHVAQPRELLTALADRLTPGGVVFAEVPLEVWKRVPIHRDPVTHVNFFTPASFRALFERSGLRALELRRERGSYGGSRKDVLVAVGTPDPAVAPGAADGPAQTARLLDPTLAMELGALLRQRRLPKLGGVRRRLRGRRWLDEHRPR